MTGSAKARVFLKLNSQFSGLNGVILLLAAGLIVPVIFADPADWAVLGLRFLGVGLLGFAALLFVLSRTKFVSKAMVHEIVLLDAVWVIGSVVLIAFFGDIFAPKGVIVVTLVAMVVAFLPSRNSEVLRKLPTRFPWQKWL